VASVKAPQSKVRSRKDGSAIPLDETDKRLMNLLQSRYPLDAEPFELIASVANLDSDDVKARTQRLLDERIIREITPIFDTRALGYSSMLVAAKVDTDNPHRAAHDDNIIREPFTAVRGHLRAAAFASRHSGVTGKGTQVTDIDPLSRQSNCQR